MKTSLALLVCLALAGLTARADETEPPSRWVIRDRIADPSDLEDTKPATLQFTQNDGGADSHLIDFAVNHLGQVSLFGPAAQDLIFTGEWHRNSVATAPSHSLLASVSFGGTAGDISRSPAVNYLFTATYKDDRIKDDQSLGGTLALSLVTRGGSPLRFLSSGFKIPFPNVPEPTALLEPLLQLGANYEDITRSSTPGDTGHVFRGSLRYQLKLTFPKCAPNVVLSAEALGWYDIERSGAYSGGTNTRRLYLVALLYYFDPKKTWGLAFKRRDGEDPIAGKPEQHFTSIAFTCNFGKR